MTTAPTDAVTAPDLAIEVRDLTRTYGAGADAFTAVRGVDLEVARGTIHALLGVNGAGKTSTMEVVEGLAPATSGEVRVLGWHPVRDRAEVRRRTGVLLQRSGFVGDLTVAETLQMWAAHRDRAPSAGGVAGDARPPRPPGRDGPQPVGRRAAPPRPGVHADGSTRRRDARRADHRARPREPPRCLGPHHRPARRGRHRAAHHALPRRGRAAGRPGVDHAGRSGRARGHGAADRGGGALHHRLRRPRPRPAALPAEVRVDRGRTEVRTAGPPAHPLRPAALGRRAPRGARRPDGQQPEPRGGVPADRPRGRDHQPADDLADPTLEGALR